MKYYPVLRIAVLSMIFGVTLSSAAVCNTIHVPKDYAKIQDAIKAASTGDTVIVDPGTYIENIDFLGKDITVKSRLGPEVTLIDANMQDSGVVFINGETKKAVIDGFTITNGCGHHHIGYGNVGGGIYCLDSKPSIRNNIIVNNKSIYGGGIACYKGVAKIINCEIKGNCCPCRGGGVFATGTSWKGKPLILNCIIQDNIALSMGSGFGGGIGCKSGPKPHFENNIISAI